MSDLPELGGDLFADVPDVDARWSPERTEVALAGLHRKRRRRVIVRSVGAGVAVLSMTVLVVTVARRGDEAPARDVVAARADVPSGTRLADGTAVIRRSPGAAFEVIEDTAARAVVRVTSGAVAFNRDVVTPAKRSALTVLSHQVSIRVYAPAVWASSSETVTEVAPTRGYVDVDVGGKTRRVAAGERASFPRHPGSVASAGSDPATLPSPDNAPPIRGATSATSRRDAGRARPRPSANSVKKKTWRKLATSGDFDKAYHALLARGLDSVRDRVDDLMLAADVARISRHPRDAVRPLSRVMTRFSSDPRASLAAFTLGRIQLEDLTRPVAAARAFRRAQVLGRGGPLAEDALAREVEAWSRAGKKDLARLRAREYLARYPRGLRVRAVKQYAGL